VAAASATEEQRTDFYYTHLHSHDKLTDIFLVSAYLGGGAGEILRQTYFPPFINAGWGWGCSWLGPPLSFILATMRVGERDSPYK
jgi:hypothetical protein